jgi:hypothetical protein
MPGGVQVYMPRLGEILTAYAQVHDFALHCLSLVDSVEQRELHCHPAQHSTFEGCAGKKAAYAQAHFRAGQGTGWTRSIYSIHPNEDYPFIVIRDSFAGPDAEASEIFTSLR